MMKLFLAVSGLLFCLGLFFVNLKSPSQILENPARIVHASLNKSAISIDTSKLKRFEFHCSIRAIEAIDEHTLWYAGSGGQYGYTEDAGATWHIDSISHPAHDNLEFRSIAATNTAIFLLSVGSPALLYRTNDKGKNWDIVFTDHDALAFYDAMAFWDDEDGIAMGDPIAGCLSIIKTNDGGDSWYKIPCDRLPPTIEGEAAFAASNSNISLYNDHVWIVTGGKKARVFHSADRGENWTVHETPIIQGGRMTGIFSCDFFDDKTGIVFGGDWENQGSTIQNKSITNDGGTTWKLLADGEEPGYRSCVQFLNGPQPSHLIAVGIPGISTSADGGTSWQKISDEGFYTVRQSGNILWMAGKNKIARLPIN